MEATTQLMPAGRMHAAVRTGRHEFVIDEPPALGGNDAGASPVNHILAALGACQIVTYQIWGPKLGIRVDDIHIRLAGTVDLRGLLGLSDDVRPGFEQIDVEVTLTGPESAERYERLANEVEAHCPVLDSLQVPVTTRLKVNSTL
ncbi:OsmC family protein [Streptosporangium sp. OZ121]|uniref:OsmC family protein n=1 Tax=Streptosporangium sp. OZ121 TaxID=3444183 RepID=UPI003F7A760D